MKTVSLDSKRLLLFIRKQKIATMPELKKALGSNSSMTVYRKLKELDYISSCSHSGKYYSLKRIAKFNSRGLWTMNSVLFSTRGTLAETIKYAIDDSSQGFTAVELEELLHVKPNESLLELLRKREICRDKMFGIYVNFSTNVVVKKRQQLFRAESGKESVLTKMEPDVLMNELKASIIIFFSLLNEKQRRFYAGLESMKIGKNGDSVISELLGINKKTVARGRKELLVDKINIDTIREAGGGRKSIKKNARDHSEN